MKRYVTLLLALMLVLLSACRQVEPEIPSAPESAASEEDLLSSTDAESTETESTESAESIASEPKPEPSEPATPSQAVSSAPSADTVADSLARHRLTPAIDYTSLESQKPSDEFLSSVADFSYLSTQQVLTSQTKNTLFCPISLYYPLALLTTSAEGNTRAELAAALGVTGMTDEELTLQCARLFSSTYCDNKYATFLTANSLWFPQNQTVLPNFARTASERFYASLHGVDFTDPLTDDQMEQWVFDNTKGLIRPDVIVNGDTAMVLCNTVYLKGLWNEVFSPYPEPMDFTTEAGEKLKTDFLCRQHGSNYYQNDAYTRVEIEMYGLGTMSFILPKEGVTLKELLTTQSLQAMISSPEEYYDIILTMPRVDITSKVDLKSMMSSLGIRDVQNPFASRLSLFENQSLPIYIDKATQETHLLWDETGLEAAAYTELNLKCGGAALSEPIEVTLDRPFLFLLHSDEGILFAGTCYQPKCEIQ